MSWYESPRGAEWIGDRLVIPIRSPLGALRGYEYRLVPRIGVGGAVTYVRRDKSRHYRLEEGNIWMGWFSRTGGTKAVVVEDTLSAMKAAQECPEFAGCSLMGTHLHRDKLTEINRLMLSTGMATYHDNWWLCLDRDATGKALYYLQQYRHLKNFAVGILEKDMKYMTRAEILHVLLAGEWPCLLES